MAALARSGESEGTWLMADRQTAGRGRLGREWVSPPGNLYASTTVRIRAGDPPPPTLALVAAVALEQLVSALVGPERVKLKWPNDLLVGRAKLSGILLERVGDAVVIGVGVNLAHHPALSERRTTSLAAEGAVAPEPMAFLREYADAFAHWLARWRQEGLSAIRSRWIARAHAKGTPLSASLGEAGTLTGLFDGLEDDGALRLRLADGGIQIIRAADIALAGG